MLIFVYFHFLCLRKIIIAEKPIVAGGQIIAKTAFIVRAPQKLFRHILELEFDGHAFFDFGKLIAFHGDKEVILL